MTRRYSYKECAALQTFPKEIEFVGKLESKYRQIGNAVPVKLAYHIAKHLKTVLSAGVNTDGGEVLLQGTEDNP
jgi:DNA (cytosine-5)-methyltransferase 1